MWRWIIAQSYILRGKLNPILAAIGVIAAVSAGIKTIYGDWRDITGWFFPSKSGLALRVIDHPIDTASTWHDEGGIRYFYALDKFPDDKSPLEFLKPDTRSGLQGLEFSDVFLYCNPDTDDGQGFSERFYFSGDPFEGKAMLPASFFRQLALVGSVHAAYTDDLPKSEAAKYPAGLLRYIKDNNIVGISDVEHVAKTLQRRIGAKMKELDTRHQCGDDPAPLVKSLQTVQYQYFEGSEAKTIAWYTSFDTSERRGASFGRISNEEFERLSSEAAKAISDPAQAKHQLAEFLAKH
jgi:hypothetical protein